MKHIFIVGSKGIPAKYGGFETFVENLVSHKKSKDIQYHISCMNNEEGCYTYNGAECFKIRVPLKGPLGRILHVSYALNRVEEWCVSHQEEAKAVYILGCRIGPLLKGHAKRLHKLGVTIYCNPDGLEWKRDKWNVLEKRILHYCESCLIRNSDKVICDSKKIKEYVENVYPTKVGNTTYIAYGATIKNSSCNERKLYEWYQQFDIKKNEYYLIVGRFVPENNYEIMLREFVRSTTHKDLVIITNIEKNKFYDYLINKTEFNKDSRIKFVGTVYDQELLSKIRENAYGYIHGHEVGGTNPSLLEALASTKLNLLLDVEFNREVGEKGALYWTKRSESLCKLISKTDILDIKDIKKLEEAAKKRILDFYNWDKIIEQYEEVWKAI